jgi:hypothetical protein
MDNHLDNSAEAAHDQKTFPPPAAVPTDQQMLQVVTAPRGNFATSLDITTDDGAAMMLKCMSAPDITLETAGETVYLVTDWHATVGNVLHEDTGEVVRSVIVRLVLDDGRIIGWSSEHTTRFWGTILAVKGHGPFKPPLKVQFGKIKSKKQGHWYPIYLAGNAAKPRKGGT